MFDFKKLFKKLTPTDMAAWELDKAHHARLEAQTASDYAASIVSYNDKRIARLTRFIQDQKATA